jgi:hypothetical protein
MKIGIQGTRSFTDYSVFLRAMGTSLSELGSEDKEFTIYSAGPSEINSMGMEFSNISERSLKARGIKIRFVKVPPSWLKNNLEDLAYFAFFSAPKEPVSDIVDLAELKNISVGIYRY